MKIQLGCAAAVLMLLCGCVSSRCEWSDPYAGQTSTDGNPVIANIEGMNSGVFLFYAIPLWSGQEGRPNRGLYYSLENHVRPKHIRRMFDIYCEKLSGNRVEDLVYEERSNPWWGLFIFWKRSIHGRAVITGD